MAKTAKPKTDDELDEEAGQRIDEAWAAKAYEELTEVEGRYLAALIRTKIPERARLSVGMKIYKYEELERKLEMLGLTSPSRRMIPDDETAKPLLDMYPVHKALPVIPSPPARTIYAFLCERYPYVFPELTLASFVNLNELQDLVADGKDRWYALCCRIDFVVCDAAMVPIFAVEYQGGGHDRVKMRNRDELKASLLEAAGVRAYQLRPKDLGDLEAVFSDFPPNQKA